MLRGIAPVSERKALIKTEAEVRNFFYPFFVEFSLLIVQFNNELDQTIGTRHPNREFVVIKVILRFIHVTVFLGFSNDVGVRPLILAQFIDDVCKRVRKFFPPRFEHTLQFLSFDDVKDKLHNIKRSVHTTAKDFCET